MTSPNAGPPDAYLEAMILVDYDASGVVTSVAHALEVLRLDRQRGADSRVKQIALPMATSVGEIAFIEKGIERQLRDKKKRGL